MSQSVIRVEGLGKRYHLAHEKRHDNLRDSLAQGARGLWRRITRPIGAEVSGEEFWALRDVSFEIQQGDVVGIIGRNGAGKSTLLKILSRITEPTTGRATIRGRIASLLEVGTGFHPELTGRDNIFLNGAILGMSRAEIARKFDEIVAFAEVERFLDTQVKHYSSGMYVRLAFSVAAHLEPEILIVDEVLAVGDVAFQKKCIGKMDAVAHQQGRTVLFVSHNLQSIRQLCPTAMLLAGGRLQTIDQTPVVLDHYTVGLASRAAPKVPAPTPDLLQRGYITGTTVETMTGAPSPAVIPVGCPWRIRVAFRMAQPGEKIVIGIGLRAADGTAVQTAWHPPQSLPAGEFEAVFEQTSVMLEAGHYTVIAGLSQQDHSLQHFEAATIDLSGEGVTGYYPRTAGVGLVLNSMCSDLKRIC